MKSKQFNYSGQLDGIEKQHDGQQCTVERSLTDAECDSHEVGQMYRVRFSDGVTIDAFEDELDEEQPQPDTCHNCEEIHKR